jgi:hypothetical protein
MYALRFVSCAVAAVSIAMTPVSEAKAQSDLSQASALSLMPVAMSLTAPALLLEAGVNLSVVAVEGSVDGTVWIVERVSDGARATLRFSGQALGASAKAVGSVITVIACSTGWLLSSAGMVVAFVPNEIGNALLYNERLSR